MGIFDKLKGAAGDHGDKVGQGLDKGSDMLDERTGGQHTEHIDKGTDMAKDHLGIADTTGASEGGAAAYAAGGEPVGREGGPAGAEEPGAGAREARGEGGPREGRGEGGPGEGRGGRRRNG